MFRFFSNGRGESYIVGAPHTREAFAYSIFSGSQIIKTDDTGAKWLVTVTLDRKRLRLIEDEAWSRFGWKPTPDTFHYSCWRASKARIEARSSVDYDAALSMRRLRALRARASMPRPSFDTSG
jgi:hypothetical protein